MYYKAAFDSTELWNIMNENGFADERVLDLCLVRYILEHTVAGTVAGH